MAKKEKVSSDEKFEKQDFDLFGALSAIDRKDYSWFSKLSEEQQRKFVPYMMTHWVSSVKNTGVMGSYYVMSTDAHANKYLFNEAVQKHPELQWMMLCASSPGMGSQRRQWIPHLNAKIGNLKERAKTKDVKDYFEKIYKNSDSAVIKQAAEEFTSIQNHRYRVAKLYPDMKISDIEILSDLISKEELDRYDRDSGE